MKHTTSVALFDYWRRARGAVHQDGGIEAAALAPLLPSLFLFDLVGGEGTRLHYCGSHVQRRFGRDLCGEEFLDLWEPDARETWRAHLSTAATHAIGLVAGMVGETFGGGFTSFEMVVLPLARQGRATGAIGSMARTGGHDDANRIRARLVSHSLRSVRFLPTSTGSGLAPRSVAPFRDMVPPNAFRARYRHLSVVEGGRLEL